MKEREKIRKPQQAHAYTHTQIDTHIRIHKLTLVDGE